MIKQNNTVEIISLVEELLIREGLESAIQNLDQSDLLALLKFCLKKIDSINCNRIVIELLSTIYIILPSKRNCEEFIEILKKLEKKII